MALSGVNKHVPSLSLHDLGCDSLTLTVVSFNSSALYLVCFLSVAFRLVFPQQCEWDSRPMLKSLDPEACCLMSQVFSKNVLAATKWNVIEYEGLGYKCFGMNRDRIFFLHVVESHCVCKCGSFIYI